MRFPPAIRCPDCSARALSSLGLPAEKVGMSFWTDAAVLGAAGIPTVLFGPGGAGLHGREEYVNVADVDGVPGRAGEAGPDACRSTSGAVRSSRSREDLSGASCAGPAAAPAPTAGAGARRRRTGAAAPARRCPTPACRGRTTCSASSPACLRSAARLVPTHAAQQLSEPRHRARDQRAAGLASRLTAVSCCG